MFNELLDFLPSSIWQYVYVPYMLTVWLVVEWARYQFDGLDSRIKPKHLTLLVGAIVGIAGHFGRKYYDGVDISAVTLLVSFLLTTWIYEYAVKVIKEKIPFLQNFVKRQNQ